MLTLLKVAVTGSIASGKTTLCLLFQKFGAYVVNADKLVHQLLSLQTDIGKEIVKLLGAEIIVENEISLKKIADKVFENRSLLTELEKRVHPAVLEEIKTLYKKNSHDKRYTLFIAEVPLLFEAEFAGFFDKIIVVDAKESFCIERFFEATKREKKEYIRRSKRLMPMEKKKRDADYVIENNGSYAELEAAAKKIYQSLTST